MVGTTLSHYKVLEKIGQGGMGEVYRAEDTNLDRDVAIKVLPEQFTQDPQRLARFEREAKLPITNSVVSAFIEAIPTTLIEGGKRDESTNNTIGYRHVCDSRRHGG